MNDFPIRRMGDRVIVNLSRLPSHMGIQPVMGLLDELPEGGYVNIVDREELDWLRSILESRFSDRSVRILGGYREGTGHHLLAFKVPDVRAAAAEEE